MTGWRLAGGWLEAGFRWLVGGWLVGWMMAVWLVGFKNVCQFSLIFTLAEVSEGLYISIKFYK